MTRTKLDGVNEILGRVDLSPVSALTDEIRGANPDLNDVLTKLDYVSLSILSQGWNENSFETTLAADVNNEFNVPSNYLRVKVISPSGGYLPHIEARVDTNRENKKFLYNKIEGTYDLGAVSVLVSVIVDLEFESMSIELQDYIIARTAREFQENSFGSISQDNILVRNEMSAMKRLNSAQIDKQDSNMITDNLRGYQITAHRPPYFYGSDRFGRT